MGTPPHRRLVRDPDSFESTETGNAGFTTSKE